MNIKRNIVKDLFKIRKSFQKDILITLFVSENNALIVSARYPSKEELLIEDGEQTLDEGVNYFG